MKLQHLVADLPLLERRNWEPSLEIPEVRSDSRRVKKGDLFVACPGPHADGHQFMEQALKAGARVLVGEKPFALPEKASFLRVADSREALGHILNRRYGFPSRKLKLVGITGTNGKTTIGYALNHLLQKTIPSAYIGTLGFRTLSGQGSLSNTTPGPEELYSLLAKMADEGTQIVAMEVSSHALAQKRVCGLEFELALFTQLTAEHLDYHRSLEEYFQAKRLLFSRTPPPKKVLINRDFSYGRRLLRENPAGKSISLKDDADYRVRDITTNLEGGQFVLEGPRGRDRFRTRLPMIHNIGNAATVLASLDLLGFDPNQFKERLEAFPGVPGRLERISGNDFTVFIDYAHTPDAFENVLSEARRLAPQRVLTLFGCGGDRDPFKRPEMTRIAYQYSDFVILTSDNPRTENPAEIMREMRQGLPSSGPVPNVLQILDRREAIGEMVAIAEPGDVIFILGKGHEDYQILGKEKVHFDDREVVRELLQRRQKRHVAI